jgi:UDP-2,3-diacylglucosamine hydrolase
MTSGEIYVIGDSHIGLSDGDEKKMVAWLERLAERKPRALYLNGDLFHYYIGDPKFITLSVRAVFSKVRELRERGIDVFYVEGNRDFFVRGSFAGEAVTAVVDSATIEAGSKRYFIIHGDMINDRDLPYRFWRVASKNPLTRVGVKLIPKPIAKRFVDSVEAKLARSNFKHKTRLPVELMESYGRQQAERGITNVVFGHFHHKLEIPAGSGHVSVLPAWFFGGEAMVIDPATGERRWEVV